MRPRWLYCQFYRFRGGIPFLLIIFFLHLIVNSLRLWWGLHSLSMHNMCDLFRIWRWFANLWLNFLVELFLWTVKNRDVFVNASWNDDCFILCFWYLIKSPNCSHRIEVQRIRFLLLHVANPNPFVLYAFAFFSLGSTNSSGYFQFTSWMDNFVFFCGKFS